MGRTEAPQIRDAGLEVARRPIELPALRGRGRDLDALLAREGVLHTQVRGDEVARPTGVVGGVPPVQRAVDGQGGEGGQHEAQSGQGDPCDGASGETLDMPGPEEHVGAHRRSRPDALERRTVGLYLARARS